jgi:hypothetical protein
VEVSLPTTNCVLLDSTCRVPATNTLPFDGSMATAVALSKSLDRRPLIDTFQASTAVAAMATLAAKPAVRIRARTNIERSILPLLVRAGVAV